MMTPREAELLEQLRQKDEQIARLTAHVSLLEQKVDLLVRRIFGARSEKLNAAQLELLLLQEDRLGKAPASAAVADCWEAGPRKPSQHRSRECAPRLPENLPVVEQVMDPREVSEDPAQWRCIDEEVSEQLDYEPARFFRRRLIRRKYVKRSDRYLTPIIAPLPPSLQERCIAAPGLLAQILVVEAVVSAPVADRVEGPPGRGRPLEVVLAGGARVLLTDVAHVPLAAQLLQILSRPC